jgi:hypothetical protein
VELGLLKLEVVGRAKEALEAQCVAPFPSLCRLTASMMRLGGKREGSQGAAGEACSGDQPEPDMGHAAGICQNQRRGAGGGGRRKSGKNKQQRSRFTFHLKTQAEETLMKRREREQILLEESAAVGEDAAA